MKNAPALAEGDRGGRLTMDSTTLAADSTEEDGRDFIQRARARMKPEVVLPSGDVSFLDCANQLFPILAKSKKMFMRGGVMHELIADTSGNQILSTVLDFQFRSRIEAHCKLKKYVAVRDGIAVKPDRCPQQTAKALMASTPASDHLPHIRGVTHCPIIAFPSANILSRGYHPDNGGVFVTSLTQPDDVPLNEATACLMGLLDEFDFNSTADRARALAMLITPALCMGGWIPTRRPIFTISANRSQSGKGYLLDLLYALYDETRCLIGKKDGGVGSLDEDIQAAMIRGNPFIQLDNLRGKLDSQLLERILTADSGTVPCRVPYAGTVEVDPLHFVFTATSNGMDTTDDLANRVIRHLRRSGTANRDSELPFRRDRGAPEAHRSHHAQLVPRWKGLLSFGCLHDHAVNPPRLLREATALRRGKGLHVQKIGFGYRTYRTYRSNPP